MSIKLSILMPTYNDERYIKETLCCVLEQTYSDWELIIVDDGSTDSTASVVKRFEDRRIQYVWQPNGDQLNALLTASSRITGDIVMLLHSDDLLTDNLVFRTLVDALEQTPEIDGVYADLVTIDADGRETGRIETPAFNPQEIIQAIVSTRGSNVLCDVFAVRKQAFFESVIPNYVLNNTIYYLNYDAFSTLNLKKVQPWYKYRLHDENYAASDSGKFVLVNGCVRTIARLFRNIIGFGQNRASIHSYFVQWLRDLERANAPEPVRMQMNKVIHSIVATAKDEHSRVPLLFKCNSGQERVYLGKDAKGFYQDYHSGQSARAYRSILASSYDVILAQDQHSFEIASAAVLFYGLFYEVRLAESPVLT